MHNTTVIQEKQIILSSVCSCTGARSRVAGHFSAALSSQVWAEDDAKVPQYCISKHSVFCPF